MANDVDASPLRYMPLDIGASYQSNSPSAISSSYSANNSSTGGFAVSYSMSGLRLDEVICLIEPTYETFTYDIELCIDPSVGPRPEPRARLTLRYAADVADAYFDSLLFNDQPMFNSVGELSLLLEQLMELRRHKRWKLSAEASRSTATNWFGNRGRRRS